MKVRFRPNTNSKFHQKHQKQHYDSCYKPVQLKYTVNAYQISLICFTLPALIVCNRFYQVNNLKSTIGSIKLDLLMFDLLKDHKMLVRYSLIMYFQHTTVFAIRFFKHQLKFRRQTKTLLLLIKGICRPRSWKRTLQ